MISQNSVIKINYESNALCIVHANRQENIIYAFCKDYSLIKINTQNSEVEEIAQLQVEKIDLSLPVSLQLSSTDKLISIVNNYGQYGYIYDIESKKLILNLDRQTYHIEQTHFPIHFKRIDDQDFLIHATDWNHLQLYDFKLQKNITKRDTNKPETDTYLDYFYGQISISPENKWVLSSGWVWHPISCLKFFDLLKWKNGSPAEPEKGNDADFGIMSYYWDRAICWLDENTIAYLYDPREEDLDEEYLPVSDMAIGTSYIRLYDVSKAAFIQNIKFNHFSKNEHFEASPDCRLFYNGALIVSSQEMGIFILDKDSGEIIFQDKNIVLDKYNDANKVFYKLSNQHSIELVKIS